MAYERLHWVESETPLSAENMNNIEDGIEELQSQKVDKVSGKGLSDQNYTAAEKTKLAGIEAGAEVNPGEATTSAAGLMSASDKAKLDDIEEGAQVNLGIVIQGESVNENALELQFNAPFLVAHSGEGTPGAITRKETISIPAASASNNGYMSKEDKAKLNGIDDNATENVIGPKKLSLGSSVAVVAHSTAILPFKSSTLISRCAVRDIALRDSSGSVIKELAITGFSYDTSNSAINVIVYNTSSANITVNASRSSVNVITFE